MKKNGLYGYYDIINEYVVYIGKDADIGNNKRYNDHKRPSEYDTQVINRAVQNHPEQYVYFNFIEGDYDDETLNELEIEAIRLFKTYKYDYPERNVFNLQRGGDGPGYRQENPSWREKNYNVIKYVTDKGVQKYAIVGRHGNLIKNSQNKEVLEELTNKLNNKETTEEEVKNLKLCDRKEIIKKAIQSRIKYNMWNPSCYYYQKTKMFRCNGGNEPRKCFALKHKSKMVPIGYFNEFVSPEIIDSIVKEAVKNEK